MDLNIRTIATLRMSLVRGLGLRSSNALIRYFKTPEAVLDAGRSHLASRGLAITSGLARGVDAAAHRGALRAGMTYAVFGCGLDTIYPRENRKLAEMTEEKGAIVAEFPLGTPPSPENFPIRNRIIAG